MTRSLVLARGRAVLVALAVALAAALLLGVAWQLANPAAGVKTAGAAATGVVTINMKVTGQKQGAFKGDDNATGKAVGLITVTGYKFELVVPTDASGLPTGRRHYNPMVVTHVMGGSSPQFLDAAATNENLKSVVVNFFRTDRTGKDVNYYRVTLTNAHVVDVRQYTSGAEVLEDDSFVFQKVEQDDFIAKTTFIDDVSGRA
jgi:type VI secretion system secreted protein Hcp